MKNFIALFILLTFSSVAFADKATVENEAKKGMRLHFSIISSYKKLDKFYKEPDLFGAITTTPIITIYIPVEEWNKLNENEKYLLSIYASSLVEDAKENPLKYAKVPSDAPASHKIKRNALNMTAKNWQIIAGKLTKNGRDIMADSVVKSGK
jgi:hypothetical protein